MEMRAIDAPRALPGWDRKNSAAAPLALAVSLLVASALAVAIQSLWIPLDPDVSWLITVSERLLAGDRLYVEIVEVNPPASVWLYLPLVWIAALLGARPEAVVAGAFLIAGCASVAATVTLASRFRHAPDPRVLAGGLAMVSLVLPMALFAQREHAALLLALPALAALALVADGRKLSIGEQIAAGMAAGLIVVIKPYFAPAILVPAVWAAVRRRSLRPLLAGLCSAAAVLAVYAFAVATLARAYFDWLPAIMLTYGAVKAPLSKLLIGQSFYPVITIGLALLIRPRRIPPLFVAWAAGAAGFLIAGLLQAKNYPNHWLPQAGLALAAAVVMLATPGSASRLRRFAVASGLAVIAACEMYFWAIVPDGAVAEQVERLAPARPSVIALSPQLSTGHPLTRNVGGSWAGSRAGLFTATGARIVGLQNGDAARAYREDLDSFALDVSRERPDVVLVHTPTKSWLMGDHAIAAAMRAYDFASAAGETEIWLRRDRAR